MKHLTLKLRLLHQDSEIWKPIYTEGKEIKTSWSQQGFPDGSAGKESSCNAGDTGDADSIPGSRRSPGGGKWQPTAVFLPGKSHGQRILVGYSSKGRKESDTTEWLTTAHMQPMGQSYQEGSCVLIVPIKQSLPSPWHPLFYHLSFWIWWLWLPHTKETVL